MSTAQTIAKLEALLTRVRSRAAAPRAAAAASPSAAADTVVAPVPVLHARAAPAPAPLPAASAPTPLPAPVAPLPDLDFDVAPEVAAPVHQPAVAAAPAPPALEEVSVLEIAAEEASLVEIASEEGPVLEVEEEEAPVLEIAADEASALEVAVPEPLESRERLVAAAPAQPEPVAQLEGLEGMEATDELLAATAVEAAPASSEVESHAPAAAAPLHEGEHDHVEPPASSRRPVSPEPEERIAAIAFGEAEPAPARHTPPPESGRLPAAPADDYEGDVTGVREAPAAAPEAIVPEVTLADLAPSDEVADVVGQPTPYVPATFLAVLDASLAL